MLAFSPTLVSQPRLLLDEPNLGLVPLVKQGAWQSQRPAHRGCVLVNGTVAMAGPGTELLARLKTRAAHLASRMSNSGQFADAADGRRPR